MKRFAVFIFSILFVLLVNFSYNQQAQKIDLLSQNLKILQERIEGLQAEADKYIQLEVIKPELEDIRSMLMDLDNRLVPVEEDQRFYKDVWSEYFRLEVPP